MLALQHKTSVGMLRYHFSKKSTDDVVAVVATTTRCQKHRLDVIYTERAGCT